MSVLHVGHGCWPASPHSPVCSTMPATVPGPRTRPALLAAAALAAGLQTFIRTCRHMSMRDALTSTHWQCQSYCNVPQVQQVPHPFCHRPNTQPTARRLGPSTVGPTQHRHTAASTPQPAPLSASASSLQVVHGGMQRLGVQLARHAGLQRMGPHGMPLHGQQVMVMVLYMPP